MKHGRALAAVACIAALGGCDKQKPKAEPLPEAPKAPVSEHELPERVPNKPDPVVMLPAEMEAKLVDARREALERWDEFEKSFREPPKYSQHTVKVAMPVLSSKSGETHQVWVRVTSIEGDAVSGKLANDPGRYIGYKVGEKIDVKKQDIQDWLIFVPPKTTIGGFSVKVFEEYEKSQQSPK